MVIAAMLVKRTLQASMACLGWRGALRLRECVVQEVAQLQAELADAKAQLQKLEAQLQSKVEWQARCQKRLDQYDVVHKQYIREQYKRKMYHDTLHNMSIAVEARSRPQ